MSLGGCVQNELAIAIDADSSSDQASSTAALVEMDAMLNNRLLDTLGAEGAGFWPTAVSFAMTSDLSCASSLENSSSISLYLNRRRNGRSSITGLRTINATSTTAVGQAKALIASAVNVSASIVFLLRVYTNVQVYRNDKVTGTGDAAKLMDPGGKRQNSCLAVKSGFCLPLKGKPMFRYT